MKKIILLLLFSLILTACASQVRYTEEEIKRFPPDIQDNIRKGQIDLGMTTEQVRYAWGSPDSIKILPPFEGKSREEWIYSNIKGIDIVASKILLFLDGRLIYIK